jgi:hypothetical protein
LHVDSVKPTIIGTLIEQPIGLVVGGQRNSHRLAVSAGPSFRNQVMHSRNFLSMVDRVKLFEEHSVLEWRNQRAFHWLFDSVAFDTSLYHLSCLEQVRHLILQFSFQRMQWLLE